MKLEAPRCIATNQAMMDAAKPFIDALDRTVDQAVSEITTVVDATRAWERRAFAMANVAGMPTSAAYTIQSNLPDVSGRLAAVLKGHRRILKAAVMGTAQVAGEAGRIAWTGSLKESVCDALEDVIRDEWPDMDTYLVNDDCTNADLLAAYMKCVNRMLQVVFDKVCQEAAGPNPGQIMGVITQLDEFCRWGKAEPRKVKGCYELTLAASVRSGSRIEYAMAADLRMEKIAQALLAPYFHEQGEPLPVSETVAAAAKLRGTFEPGDEVAMPAGVSLILRKSAIKIRVPEPVMECLLILIGDRLAQRAAS